MGIPTVTAARIYKGQRLHKTSGEEQKLSWDQFPHLSLSKTYGLDVQTSDSANTATAYLCGVKANVETLGVDSRVKSGVCHNDTSKHLPSIMQWAQDAGMWTGFVTTSKVTDATPAGSYAHSGHRDWEAVVPERCHAEDIAYQLIHRNPGAGFKVILGGGRKMFRATQDEEGKDGMRKDGKDLIKDWHEARSKMGNASYVWNRQQLLSVMPGKTEFLLGIFDNDHVPYVIERSTPDSTKPTLPEMTRVAVEILKKAPKGFVLLVEGARIDMAHHKSKGGSALEEALEFDQAVQETRDTLKMDDSLLVVTADHSHTFTMGGYPKRGTNILGIAGYSDVNHLPFTVITYGNGPGFSTSKENFTNEEVAKPDYVQRSAFPLKQETHGGEDVAVYATGPWAHLYTGVHDQSYIPHVMAHAACIGRFKGDKCATPDKTTGTGAAAIPAAQLFAVIASALGALLLR
ncbi:alkaline phosphatase, tissue-nonspecific isozyme [Dermacentor silvarum]|uniref:alkaline phosphatase, tissue-nonspecific isozyme n=1 Tax=Dermacentor silvarum TaxID=543639 RepID=UPI001896DC13|nr:alkaline phosphatase, tissue-nonspecific isozyme [Dermacentor silvarum]